VLVIDSFAAPNSVRQASPGFAADQP